MNKRNFIKKGAIFVPAIFLPKLIRGQGFTLRDPAFVGKVATAVAATNACATVNDASLQAYWKLDEASGDALDAKGSNNLPEAAACASVAGVIGTSRECLSAGSKFFALSDNAALSTGDIDFSLGAWVYYSTTLVGPTYPGIISKFYSANQHSYAIYLDGDQQKYGFLVSTTGSDQVTLMAANAGDPSDNAWHFVVAWHDSVANTLNIQVDGGTADSVAHTTGTFDGTSIFALGALDSGNIWTGRIDEAFFTKRVLTAGERTALYNSGAGCRPTGL